MRILLISLLLLSALCFSHGTFRKLRKWYRSFKPFFGHFKKSHPHHEHVVHKQVVHHKKIPHHYHTDHLYGHHSDYDHYDHHLDYDQELHDNYFHGFDDDFGFRDHHEISFNHDLHSFDYLDHRGTLHHGCE